MVIVKLALQISWAVEPLSLVSGGAGIKLECLVEFAHKTTGAWCLFYVWGTQHEGRREFLQDRRNRFQPPSLKLNGVQRSHKPTHYILPS